MGEHAGRDGSKEVFSSDFALQYALSARGWNIEPWEETAQMDRKKDEPLTGRVDSTFRHYCSCYPGGKPNYNLKLSANDERLVKNARAEHNAANSNCQMCYSLEKYVELWRSAKCTNHLPFEYSEKLLRTHFPARY